MQACYTKSPIQSPFDRLATITLPPIRGKGVDADIAVAVVFVAARRFDKDDAANGGW